MRRTRCGKSDGVATVGQTNPLFVLILSIICSQLWRLPHYDGGSTGLERVTVTSSYKIAPNPKDYCTVQPTRLRQRQDIRWDVMCRALRFCGSYQACRLKRGRNNEGPRLHHGMIERVCGGGEDVYYGRSPTWAPGGPRKPWVLLRARIFGNFLTLAFSRIAY